MTTQSIHKLEIKLHNPGEIKIAIVASCWNADVIQRMITAATTSLTKHGILKNNIIIKRVPGAYELPLGVLMLAEQENITACVALGCVVKGDTRHDEYINHAVAKALMDIMLKTKKPIGFGLLTTETQAQADDRSGGCHGNKGDEAADAVLSMLQSFY